MIFDPLSFAGMRENNMFNDLICKAVNAAMDSYTTDVNRIKRDYENALNDLESDSPMIRMIKAGRDLTVFEDAYNTIYENMHIAEGI